MKKLVISTYIVLAALAVQGQQTVFEESETVYSKETAGGLTLHTNGWGLNFYLGTFTSGFTKMLWHAELVSMTSPRQYKIPVDRGAYFFGKLNSVTFLRTSWGFQKDFLPRQSVKGITVSYVFNAGITHAFIKPVYLMIRQPNNSITDERYDPESHSRNNIVGRSPFYLGYSEMSYRPGLFLKGALNFDYAGKSNMVRAIEVGVAGDFFATGIPMMAYEDPRQFFVTAFVNFEFGVRKFAGQTKENTPSFE
ncbi:MAG: hypothetical protein RIC15_09460 [Vicingaceae bacterium]